MRTLEPGYDPVAAACCMAAAVGEVEGGAGGGGKRGREGSEDEGQRGRSSSTVSAESGRGTGHSCPGRARAIGARARGGEGREGRERAVVEAMIKDTRTVPDEEGLYLCQVQTSTRKSSVSST